ncbi:MAG: hypothetical protein FJ298_07790 [Planctomycetes bacterium]|nr:hypothetical protein [Planctomycetota bacterium]
MWQNRAEGATLSPMQVAQFVSAFVVGAGLSIDSCLVALAYGVWAGGSRLALAVRVGVVFGLIQAGMLAIGWLVGAPVASLFHHIDHWIAFGLLSLIGVRTIRERERSKARESGIPTFSKLVLAGIATSIDALAVGFGMSLGEGGLGLPLACTFTLTALGAAACFASGSALGARAERAARWSAGLVLIALGIYILLEHLLAASPAA